MRQFIDLAYAALADDGGYERRGKLDEALLASLPDRDAWGADPAAQRALRAMMAAAGPRPQPEVDPAP